MRLYIKIWTIEGIFKLSGLFNQYKYSKRITQTSKYVRVLCPQLSNRWNHISESFINLSKVFTGCLFMASLQTAGGQLAVCGGDTSATAPWEGSRAAGLQRESQGQEKPASLWGPRPLSQRWTSTKPRGRCGPQTSSDTPVSVTTWTPWPVTCVGMENLPVGWKEQWKKQNSNMNTYKVRWRI